MNKRCSMTMKRLLIIGLVIGIILLSGFGLIRIMRRALRQNPAAAGAVMMMNKTDSDVLFMVRTTEQRTDWLSVGPHGYTYQAMPLSKNEMVRSLLVRYGHKKYRFADLSLLNMNQESLTRHFAICVLKKCDPQWDRLKERFAKQKISLDEESKYLLLSSYDKLGTFLDDDANVQVVRIRG